MFLGCGRDESKLPPFVVHKGTPDGTIARNFRSEGYVNVVCQKKAWMDEHTMLVWIEQVWKPVAEVGPPKLLLLDHCTSHMTAKVMKRLGDLRTIVDYVPPGYTSKLQVMDVGINGPFKTYLRNAYTDFNNVNLS